MFAHRNMETHEIAVRIIAYAGNRAKDFLAKNQYW
jgi:hypothetical protein